MSILPAAAGAQFHPLCTVPALPAVSEEAQKEVLRQGILGSCTTSVTPRRPCYCALLAVSEEAQKEVLRQGVLGKLQRLADQQAQQVCALLPAGAGKDALLSCLLAGMPWGAGLA